MIVPIELNYTYNKVKINESMRSIFKKLYTLGQFLFLSDISPKSDILEEKIKELENELKEEIVFNKDPLLSTFNDSKNVSLLVILRARKRSPFYKS
jgi:cob(I)alamin adenosyltransferase